MIYYVVIFLLSAITAALCVKIILMKRSADEIKNGVLHILSDDTNAVLTLTSGDKNMRSLASVLNSELKELRRKKREYERGDTALKNAVTGISHDLRTPLTAVSGYAQLMLKEEMSAKAREYLEIITDRAQSMKTLTEELLNYSVISADGRETEKKPTDISELLTQCLADNYLLLDEAGITPAIDIPDKIIRAADGAALKRVYNNIISNAAKYSDGDLMITAKENGEVRFSNHAKALSNIRTGKLFDRFYTVNEARGSTGLGLSIARTLVEKTGGSISADYDGGVLTVTVKV